MTAQETVGTLNDWLWGENTDRNLDHFFSYQEHGMVESISFYFNLNFCSAKYELWNDQDSDLKYYEDTDTYEDLGEYCKRKLKELSKKTQLLIKQK